MKKEKIEMCGAYEEYPGVEWVERRRPFIKVVEERCSGLRLLREGMPGGCYEISAKKSLG